MLKLLTVCVTFICTPKCPSNYRVVFMSETYYCAAQKVQIISFIKTTHDNAMKGKPIMWLVISVL